jgi:hypothetical protein
MPYKNPEVAKQKNRERYLAKKPEILAKCKAYYETHKEQHQSATKKWSQNNKEQMDAYYAQWRRENTERIALKNKRYKDKLRDECFAAYGNKCECCGEVRKEFFAMDHVNGGGGEHRKSVSMLRQAAGIHKWLRDHGYPKDFRILCHNCNSSRQYYGYCPHERERIGANSSSVSALPNSPAPEASEDRQPLTEEQVFQQQLRVYLRPETP